MTTKKKNRSMESLIKINTGILVFFLIMFFAACIGGYFIYQYFQAEINGLLGQIPNYP